MTMPHSLTLLPTCFQMDSSVQLAVTVVLLASVHALAAAAAAAADNVFPVPDPPASCAPSPRVSDAHDPRSADEGTPASHLSDHIYLSASA